MRRILGFLLSLLLSAISLAAPIAAQSDRAYRIGPKDLLEIQVFEAPDLNGTLRVSEEGKITLPLIGQVHVAGLTQSEAREMLKDLLESKYLQRGRATVSLELSELRSRPINVIGAVGEPGPLNLSGSWTLLEALTAAGGLKGSHGNALYVIRRANNGLSDQVEIALDELLVKGNPRVNIPIYAGDLINVPQTVDLTISCLGEVENPSVLSFRSDERITLLSAIARAGGLTERASKKILIKRESDAGATDEIVVDYKAIISGRLPDFELRRGDVIVVKQSFF